MLPSSLIFAVILAIWAAYLMQHWVRRRDHIATARSVDRFSEAMRVLERRQQRAAVDFATPTPRSYAISPARPAAPDVVVKRAGLSSGAAITHGGVAGQRATATALLARPGVQASRTRGIALLVAAAVMVILTGLGMFSVLPGWSALVGAGLFAATLLAVRFSVRAALRQGVDSPWGDLSAQQTSALRQQAERRVEVRRSAAAAGGGAAAAFAANVQVEADDLREVMTEAVSAAVRPASGSLVYDLEAVEQVRAAVPAVEVNDAPTVPAEMAPGTWQPVAVPPPTYTLKAKAQSRVLPSEMPSDGTIVALDEEDEELPTAIRGLA